MPVPRSRTRRATEPFLVGGDIPMGGVLFEVMLAAVFAVALFLGGAWYWNRCEWVDAGYVGMMYTAGHGLETKVYHPGRVYVPPFSQLLKYPTKVNLALYTNDPMSGEVKAADAVTVTTNDNAS